MTSKLSGYVTGAGGQSDQQFCDFVFSSMWTNITLPPGHAVVVSFQEFVPFVTNVHLFGFSHLCDRPTSQCREEKTELWRRFDMDSDFAQMYTVKKLSVLFKNWYCSPGGHFQLFFSFFPESRAPQKLSSGLWNCSVDFYPSFGSHLACNLETECEDGRDETGDCAFSSVECNGLISLCNRCFTFVTSLREFNSSKADSIQRGNEYCLSLKATLGFPDCLHDWYTTFQNLRKIHPLRLQNLVVGLYSNDVTLPAMYRHGVLSQDRTVFHHSAHIKNFRHGGHRVCFKTRFSTSQLKHSTCATKAAMAFSHGAFCEKHKNNTKENSGSVSLISAQIALPRQPLFLTRCPEGHVTFVFLLCGSMKYRVCHHEPRSCSFFPLSSLPSSSALTGRLSRPVPTFNCSFEQYTISYTLVCDFLNDCPDMSDESFCQHRVCLRSFTCSNGQCLSYDMLCDQLFQCQDMSDEDSCAVFRQLLVHNRFLPSPVLIRFDGMVQFTATPMNSSELCPDGHYRCPGEFNDCLPVYTRCNGMYDCIGHQDEDGCQRMTCPGFFRCRLSTVCVHIDQVCDGWPHCPEQDDELLCDVICPSRCFCQGHAFLCPQSFSVNLYPDLRYLDATGSGIALSEVSQNAYLIHLVLAQCSLSTLPVLKLLNLIYLDLGGNEFQRVNMTIFLGLKSLRVLSLSNNPVSSIFGGHLSTFQQSALSSLDLSQTTLTVFDADVLSQFSLLQKLDLTSTSIHTISNDGFQSIPLVSELLLSNSPLKTFQPDIFKGLSYLEVITTENYKLCCKRILPRNFDDKFCYAPRDEISSCEDLLKSGTYRGFLWLISVLSLTGNALCFLVRMCQRKTGSSSGFGVFVINLAIADFFMGVYIAIIGAADEQFRGDYLHHDEQWRNSVACKAAGFLSLLSSEVSAFIIWLITLDRFIALTFPFTTLRFDRTSAGVVCALTWLMGWVLALVPLLPVTSHWEFYSQTGTCFPLPISRELYRGRVYSFSVLIVLNFALFLLISAGQTFIYRSVQNSTLKTNSTKVSRDVTIARRLITVAVTDFMCWFPIGLCGILALAGIPIPGEVNVALAVFVLPLNSAINPCLYTLNTLVEKRRKHKEAKLLKWMEVHADLN